LITVVDFCLIEIETPKVVTLNCPNFFVLWHFWNQHIAPLFSLLRQSALLQQLLKGEGAAPHFYPAIVAL